MSMNAISNIGANKALDLFPVKPSFAGTCCRLHIAKPDRQIQTNRYKIPLSLNVILLAGVPSI